MKNSSTAKILFVALILINFSCGTTDTKKSQELSRLMREGNNAFGAKQYDKAISFYDEALKIVPNEPAFLSNKSQSIRLKTIDKYNASLKTNDPAGKEAIKNEAKRGLEEAISLADNALKGIKDGVWTSLKESNDIEQAEITALSSRFDSLRLLAIIVDRSKVDAALKTGREYLELEPDKAKKIEVQLLIAKMFIDVQKGDLAVVEFKKILESEPNNLEALLGTGMALAQLGNEDQLKEAKKYLQQFIQLAPENHPKMSTAKEILKGISN